MFTGQRRHRAVLALLISAAVVTACDRGPTEPSARLTHIAAKPRSIEGDTLGCPYGWIVINGRYECVPE